jgi:hypothetical protein
MLLVCCFCEKVSDDTMRQSQWQHLHPYLVSRNLRPEGRVLSYTCCDHCLLGDPHAIAFRTRQNESRASADSAAAGREQTYEAHTAGRQGRDVRRWQ